jgi:toxin HigB-1
MLYGYTVHYAMLIRRFRHKGLRALYEDDDGSRLPAASVAKIKRILAALEYADNLSQVASVPGWKLHPLKGDRKGEYSITVTHNWRITFAVHGNAITDVHFEDYH